MAESQFNELEKAEIKSLAREAVGGTPLEEISEVESFADGDIVPFMKKKGEDSYETAKIQASKIGSGGGGGTGTVTGVKVGASGTKIDPVGGVVTIPEYETGAQVNPTVENKAATLSYGSTSTIAKIGNTDITVTMPSSGGGGGGGDDYVPITRTINGKPLNADITLTASDVEALPSNTSIPSKTSDLTNDSGFITSSDIPSSLPADGGNADTVDNHTVATDVPANAVFTDTTYESKTAAAGGTDVSLVTTGEKDVWNNKQDAIVFNTAYNASTNKAATMADIASTNVSADEEDITNASGLLKLKNRTASTGEKGMVILRKGTALAAQMTATNTTYVIRYAFDLNNSEVELPTGCSLVFEGGTIGNGYLSGVIQNDTICQSWFSDFGSFVKSLNNLSGFDTIVFSEGEYTTSETIKLVGFKNLRIVGNNAVIKSPVTAIMINGLESDDLSKLGVRSNNAITSTMSPGDYIVTCDTTEHMEVGMTVCIMDMTYGSYNSSRSYYRQGELAEIKEVVDGNTIKLTQPVVGTYSNLSNLRITTIPYYTQLDIRDITVESASRTDTAYGLWLCVSSVKAKNVNAYGYTYSFAMYCCYNCMVNNCNVVSSDESGDVYGIEVINCQNVRVSDCSCSAAHHAIVLGNTIGMMGIVNRYVYIDNCYGDNKDNSFGGGIETHGATEYLYVTNCRCNGIEIGGDHIYVRDCVIDGRKSSAYTIQIADMVYSNIVFDGCTIYCPKWNYSYANKRDKRSKFVFTNNHLIYSGTQNIAISGENADFVFTGNNFENSTGTDVYIEFKENTSSGSVLNLSENILSHTGVKSVYLEEAYVCRNRITTTSTFGLLLTTYGYCSVESNNIDVEGTAANYPIYVQGRTSYIRNISGNTVKWLAEQTTMKTTIYVPRDVCKAVVVSDNSVTASSNIKLVKVDSPNTLYVGINYAIGDATLPDAWEDGTIIEGQFPGSSGNVFGVLNITNNSSKTISVDTMGEALLMTLDMSGEMVIALCDYYFGNVYLLGTASLFTTDSTSTSGKVLVSRGSSTPTVVTLTNYTGRTVNVRYLSIAGFKS